MNILFVCTGNTCRSPMAEAFMNKIAEDNGCTWISAFSRGLAAYGEKASGNSVLAAKEYGADITRHQSEQLTLDDITGADLILTMTKSQSEFLKLEAKKHIGKVFSISEYAGTCDIPDPYGQSLEVYSECAKSIWDNCNIIYKKLMDEK